MEFDRAATLYGQVLKLDVLLDQQVKASHEWQKLI
jgi:hypothetical protein